MLSNYLQKLLDLLKAKGNSMIWVALAFAALVGLGYVSVHYYGPDNEFEQEIESTAEDLAESELHMDKGTLKPEMDAIFPHKKP
jgi:hypothetical protein